MDVSPSWEAASRSTTQQFSSILLNPEGLLSCSKEPATGPYRKQDESSPYHPIIFI
jgi:hypothetical protein